MNVQSLNELRDGEPLVYTGPGFFGFDPHDRSLTYVMPDEGTFAYIWVKYKNWYKRLLVNHVSRRRSNAA